LRSVSNSLSLSLKVWLSKASGKEIIVSQMVNANCIIGIACWRPAIRSKIFALDQGIKINAFV